jgi:hypothetical protein
MMTAMEDFLAGAAISCAEREMVEVCNEVRQPEAEKGPSSP